MPAPKTLQVSCIQLHWAKSLERNLERTLHYISLAAAEGSRVVLFPEANLTGYYFPDIIQLSPAAVQDALDRTCRAAKGHNIWVTSGDPARQKAAVDFVINSLEKGTLKPVIDRVFPLDQIVEAHRYLEASEQIGKIVVTI